jgi:hypothetical protein
MLAGKGRKAACDQPVGQERSVDQVDLAEAEAHLSELIARVVNRQFPSIEAATPCIANLAALDLVGVRAYARP